VDGEVGSAAGGERGADQAKAQPVERSGRHGIGRARRLLPGLLLIALLLAGPPLLLASAASGVIINATAKYVNRNPLNLLTVFYLPVAREHVGARRQRSDYLSIRWIE
jgi:hypothetical protein